MTATLIPPADVGLAFQYHNAVAYRWHEFAQEVELVCTRRDLSIAWAIKPFVLSEGDIVESTVERRVAEKTIVTPDNRLVKVGVISYSNDAEVDCCLRVGHGHTETDQVGWDRMWIRLTGPVETTLDDDTGGMVGATQCLPSIRFRYNFAREMEVPIETKRVFRSLPPPYFSIPKRPDWLQLVKPRVEFHAPFEQTDTVPVYPGRTGDQENFGFNHILVDIWEDLDLGEFWYQELRNEACRPGHFAHPNGDHVYDDDARYDRLIYDGGAGFDSRCSGYDSQAWFKPADTKAIARTRAGTRWRGWDRQHWGLGPLAQAVWRYGDLSLLWELEDASTAWLFANPSVVKGTTHHTQVNARANGRSIQSAAAAYHTLKRHGRDKIAERLRVRIIALAQLQIVKWDADGPIVKRGYASAWMHAEWVNGLAAALHIPMPIALTQAIVKTGNSIATFVLASFKLWYGGHWAIPYKVDAEGSALSDTPSNGLSTWCVSSVQLLAMQPDVRTTQENVDKQEAILGQYVYNRKADRRGGLPRWIEWLVR